MLQGLTPVVGATTYANTLAGDPTQISTPPDPTLIGAIYAQVTFLANIQSYQHQLGRLQLLEFCFMQRVFSISPYTSKTTMFTTYYRPYPLVVISWLQ